MAASGAKEPPKIRAINKATVHRICSGQVVLDLATAVKELIENSLDAGATFIDVRLKESGAEMVEVADNGCGVSPDNFQGLALKYHTSKISEFGDLQTLSSFGFRGEALSSLCSLADVTIVTRTEQEKLGTRLVYDHTGNIVSQESVARSVGTTVLAGKLFSTLPVRHKDFIRNIRREHARLLSVLQSYAVIAKGVRLICSNQTGKNGRHNLMQTYGCPSVKENFATVFGTKTAACLTSLNVAVLGDECSVEGFVSKPGYSSGKACHLFYVNGRPVDMPKFSKLLNDLYKSFNSQRPPMAVLNFNLPTTAYDVNVTPDKRKVFIHAEGALLSALRQQLEALYSADEQTYVVQNTPDEKPRENIPRSQAKDMATAKDVAAAEDMATGEGESEGDEDYVDKRRAFLEQAANFSFSKRKSPVRRPSFVDLTTSECDKFGEDQNDHGEKRTQVKLGVSEPSSEDLGTYGHDKLEEDENDEDKRCAFLQQTANFSFKKPKGPVSKPFLVSLSSLATPSKAMSGIRRCTEENSSKGVNMGSHVSQAPKVVQSSLSTFLSRKKRPSEIDGGLLSEQPVLKYMYSAEQGRQGRKIAAIHDGQEQMIPLSGSSSAFADTETSNSCCREVTSDGSRSAVLGESAPPTPPNTFPDIVHTEVESTTTGAEVPGGDNFNDASEGEVTGANLELEGDKDCLIVHFCFKRFQLKSRLRSLQHRADEAQFSKSRCFRAATLASDVEIKEGVVKEHQLVAATKELERTFNKADFKTMQVLGQFNLGFILGKLEDDIYIIDQHASDEKYNYERLLKSTTLNRQPLLQPLPLELSAVEEVLVSTHMDIFRQNGFDFIKNDEALPGQRLGLSAIPFSKNVSFGVGDVQELISLLADSPTFGCGDHQNDTADRSSGGSARKFGIRPSRVRGMLASRACRSSIMIGDALSKRDMERVMSHLADLDSPWNCPHGRPTMRHLAYLPAVRRK